MSDAHDHDEIGVGSVHREIDPATVGPQPGDLERAIAAQVRAYRLATGMSVAEMADKVGISKAMLSKIENALTSCSLTTLGRLAHGLDLDDVLLDDRIGRQRLDRVVLHAITATDLRQLEQLDCGGADVDADQRRRFRCEQAHTFSPSHAPLRAKDAPLH